MRRTEPSEKPAALSPAARRLSLAAVAGIVSGLAASCSRPIPSALSVEIPKVDDAHAVPNEESTTPPRRAEPLVVARAAKPGNCCKGRNECKGKGNCRIDGVNECKGLNDCKGKGGCEPETCDEDETGQAVAPTAKSCCKGLNQCKGQGNCKTGSHGCKGMNSCKGLGGCKSATCP